MPGAREPVVLEERVRLPQVTPSVLDFQFELFDFDGNDQGMCISSLSWPFKSKIVNLKSKMDGAAWPSSEGTRLQSGIPRVRVPPRPPDS